MPSLRLIGNVAVPLLCRQILRISPLLLLFASDDVRGASWQTTVVARGSELSGWPKLSDRRVAWSEGIGTAAEVFVYEDGAVAQITDNAVGDFLIDIAGNHIAWSQSITREDRRLDVTLILNGRGVANGLPYLSDACLAPEGFAWAEPSHSGRPSQIYFDDGSGTKVFAYAGATFQHNPDISGSRIVWSGFDDDGNHAYMFDGLEVTKLPAGVGIGQTPRIDGDFVTGTIVSETGHSAGVTRYNVVSGQVESFRSEDRFTSTPYIAEEQMAWHAHVDGESQLFALDAHGAPVQLTSSGVGLGPFVTESFVAWNGPGPERGIFVFDGTSTIRIAEADELCKLTDADEDSLVWLRSDGTNFEIVLATLVPEPNGVAVAGMAILGCFGHIRGRQRLGPGCSQRRLLCTLF